MTTKTLAPTIVALAATLLASRAETTQTADTSAPELSPMEQTLHNIKNPAPWFSWGGDLRVRNEYFNNALSLTSDRSLSPPFAPYHSQDYFRFRGRVWTSISPITNLTLNARLSAEPRDFMEPSTFDTDFEHQGMQWRYGIFDTLNFQWKNPIDLPATVTVGRQDIFLGDGWLVGDGSPEDGSFTYFLDAARATIKLDEQHTTIDLIGIVQYPKPDSWLPTLGPSTTQGGDPQPLLLTDQIEKGAILWVTNKSVPAANVDGYFIYKHDTGFSEPAGQRLFDFGDDADIYTVGGRLSGELQDHWKYSAEGAYQFGQKHERDGTLGPGFRDIRALGVNSKVSYLFKDSLNDQVSLSYEFLSGDNPNTRNDEMFDVLWGRWPRWSEMYNVYSYVSETRVAQTANLHRIGPTWTMNPMKDMEFDLSYYALFADQEVPTRTIVPSAFSNDGTFRGHYLQSVLKYKFSRHLSGHLWGEVLFPGDYYASKQVMSFLRAEVMMTF
jgi:Alginate export